MCIGNAIKISRIRECGIKENYTKVLACFFVNMIFGLESFGELHAMLLNIAK